VHYTQVQLGEQVGQLKKNLTKAEKLRMGPDYHFGPKLKSTFNDGPKLMDQSSVFTKQIHESNKHPVHSTHK